MIHVLVLVCSIYVPPEACTQARALDFFKTFVPRGLSGLGGQISYIADDGRPLDWSHYLKVKELR